MSKRRRYPVGTIQISLYLVPGTDEYSAFVSIKNKYQDEMNKRRQANPNQLCKTDTEKCELIRGSLFALDQIPQEELPAYIDSAFKQKGRHSLKPDIDESEKADSDAKLGDRANTLLH